MPTQHTCSFCGRNFTHGQGTMFVRRDGTILWFCSRKCRIYATKHRKDPRKYKWTERYGGKTR
ncbi:MAG: 50S ribosomal protein L24e [Aigarchaeota archaeon]|nr:50S ribosomal protein L24e [Aigarchaeota archaeon]MDH5703475.1 50S ribosomal protein L24e [Aigarchaeota archaeon]